jgi:hypothetical protein
MRIARKKLEAVRERVLNGNSNRVSPTLTARSLTFNELSSVARINNAIAQR